ncbi:MAG: hypothetical protein K6E97_06735 [Treponema sp.]|nr:hypothetical protein [Treponema sp.]
MKKIATLLSILLMTACALTFTACNELFEATYDTWYEREVEYQGDNGEIQLNLYTIYSKNGIAPSAANKLKNNPFGNDVVGIPAGLTVVCRPFTNASSTTLNAIAEGLTDKHYLIKNWPVDSTINLDEEVEGAKNKFNLTNSTWTTIMLFGGVHYGSMPTCLKNTTEGNELTPWDTDNFNWKKLMAQILIDKYLSE